MNDYDHYIVAFSGGKDSLACVLHLLDIGIPKEKIELWHHLVDGKEESTLMDWPCTEDYCRKVAEYLKIPIFFSWKEGGFEREMLRQNTPTAPNKFEYSNYISRIDAYKRNYKISHVGKQQYPYARYSGMSEAAFFNIPDNVMECGLSGGNGPLGTRMKFPQVSADLRVRWCSAYLKIDVCTAAINNQVRFHNKKTLVITGERAQESTARSKYKVFDVDRSDNRFGKSKRHVDHWRPVHSWTSIGVWNIIKKHKINPHPAYRLGWGRLSCMFCIFGNEHQWASAKHANQIGFTKISDYEKEFGISIKRTEYIDTFAKKGNIYEAMSDEELIWYSQKKEFDEPVYIEDWKMPAGAYAEEVGPT